MTMEILCISTWVVPRDRELKFPLRANRNLTLSITPLSPPASTQAGPLEEIASDVIYFTVLFLSFSFLSPSLLPYLFMMFAVIGSGLSGHVAEILIPPPTHTYTHTIPFSSSPFVLHFEIRSWHMTKPLQQQLIPLFSFAAVWPHSFSFRCHIVASLPSKAETKRNTGRGGGEITSLYSSSHPSWAAQARVQALSLLLTTSNNSFQLTTQHRDKSIFAITEDAATGHGFLKEYWHRLLNGEFPVFPSLFHCIIASSKSLVEVLGRTPVSIETSKHQKSTNW